MSPFYFGSGGRRLFGLYTPALVAGGRQRGIVLCHPWGQEYLRAHRSMRQLTNLLAGAGFHVLRFDYFGTGDSAGEMTQADLKGWQADIDTAIQELKDTSNLSRVSLLGLRLGGTLAASVASRKRVDVDALVLWDPVVCGRDYLAELRSCDASALKRPAAAGGGVEVLGFPLTEVLACELEAIDLLGMVPAMPKRSLVVVSQSLPSHDDLARGLEARAAAPAPIELIAATPAWLEDRNLGAGAVPVKLLQRVVEWLG